MGIKKLVYINICNIHKEVNIYRAGKSRWSVVNMQKFILVLLLVIILQLNLFLPTLVYMYSQCSTYIAINTNIAVYKKRENAFIIILLKTL